MITKITNLDAQAAWGGVWWKFFFDGGNICHNNNYNNVTVITHAYKSDRIYYVRILFHFSPR